MSSILVVDDQAFTRELIVEVLTARGYDCVGAADGSLAWPLLQAGNVGLVICDMVMPIVDGLRLLREIRGDTRLRTLPVIVLTGVIERASIVEAKALGVRDYLLKNNFSLPDLMARIERILGAQAKPFVPAAAAPDAAAATARAAAKASSVHLPRLLERDPLAAAAADPDALRTLGGAVAEVTRLVDLGDAGTSDLARVIRHDPVLAARALRKGAHERTATIEDAVRRVGPVALKELAASPAPITTFPLGKSDGPEMLRAWEYRVAVATLMERLVPRSDKIGPGVAYAVGLLHDLGELLLRQRFGDAYRAAQQFAVQANQPLAAVQSHVLGMSPGELAAATLAAIHAPPLISEAVARYWTPPMRNGATPEAADTLAAGLRLATEFAHALQMGPKGDPRVGPVAKAAYRAAMLAPTDVRAAEVRAEALAIVAVAAGPDAPDAAAPPVRDVAIGYVRHSTFASVDPLETTLAQLAKAEASAALPHAPLLSAMAGLVVAVPNLKTPDFTPAAVDDLRRAGGKPTLPVLFVTSDYGDADVPLPPGIQAVRAPLPVRDLAKFVAAC